MFRFLGYLARLLIWELKKKRGKRTRVRKDSKRKKKKKENEGKKNGNAKNNFRIGMPFLNITLATFLPVCLTNSVRAAPRKINNSPPSFPLPSLEHRWKDIFGYFYTTQSRRWLSENVIFGFNFEFSWRNKERRRREVGKGRHSSPSSSAVGLHNKARTRSGRICWNTRDFI